MMRSAYSVKHSLRNKRMNRKDAKGAKQKVGFVIARSGLCDEAISVEGFARTAIVQRANEIASQEPLAMTQPLRRN